MDSNQIIKPMSKFKDVKLKVRAFLHASDELKDDDKQLIAQIWMSELNKIGVDPKKISGFQLLQIFIRNKLSNPETIRRTRQKLQEEHSYLRGKKYKLRQTKLQEKQKKELGYDK